jgi:hypothetical protein
MRPKAKPGQVVEPASQGHRQAESRQERRGGRTGARQVAALDVYGG